MPRQLIAVYQNGNYVVKLYSDGTKEKITNEDSFIAAFPDSIDLKITNYCDMNCPMCHEKSSVDGKEGDLTKSFLSTLKKGTELAIGGGNPLSHSHLLPFLERMKNQGVICNLTVNEQHFLKSKELISRLINDKLIYGLGISIKAYNEEVVKFACGNSNVVLHIINGLFTDYDKLSNKGLKILILGYKRFGRGAELYNESIEKNMQASKKGISSLFGKFRYISFDNLALDQLELRSLISKDEFEKMYMGDDGEGTMYVDLVEEKYAKSSTSTIRYNIENDIGTMFKRIQIKK
jgi:hypothetical protein